MNNRLQAQPTGVNLFTYITKCLPIVLADNSGSRNRLSFHRICSQNITKIPNGQVLSAAQVLTAYIVLKYCSLLLSLYLLIYDSYNNNNIVIVITVRARLSSSVNDYREMVPRVFPGYLCRQIIVICPLAVCAELGRKTSCECLLPASRLDCLE